MGEAVLPGDIASVLNDILRRLSTLESTSRLASSAIQDGALTILDSSGNTVVIIGKQGSVYGVTTQTPAGFPIFETTNEGLVFPGMPAPMVNEQTGQIAVTSGTLVTTFGGQFDAATADSITVIVGWSTDAATTGELVLTNNVVGGASSSAKSLPAGSSGFQTFLWKHSQPVGSGPFFPMLQARRTSGAGNVNVFTPYTSYQVPSSRSGATTTG